MARKKATPVEEPEQSGEDAFLEQTGETAEGVAGAETDRKSTRKLRRGNGR